jgi:hypothetical protein
MKFGIRSFGAACAVIAFIFSLILGVWYSLTGYGIQIIELLTSFYAGIFHFTYNPLLSILKNLQNNLFPIFLLSIFSLVDAFIAGSVFAFFYNILLSREKK